MTRWVSDRMRHVAVRELGGGRVLLQARWCDRFACRLRGLTFRRALHPDEGLVLVESRESRNGAAIHMLFVFFPIGVLWADSNGQVVDLQTAQPFRPLYRPRSPARYIVEGPIHLLEKIQIGDRISFEPIAG